MRQTLRSCLALAGLVCLPLAEVRGQDTATYAAPPGAPYAAEEVAVRSPYGHTLGGTLTLPRGGRRPLAVVVLISGTGPHDRDGAIRGDPYRPFRQFADTLSRRGIAVLRMDDRGEGGSTGNFAASTSFAKSAEVEAAVRFLAARPEVARNKVGLIGHSEGGIIAPIVATRSPGVAYVVMLAGTGIPGDSLLRLQGAAVLRSSGASEEMVRRQGEVQGRIFAAARQGRDSADVARRVRASLTAEERAGVAAAPDSLPASVRPLLSPWFRYFLTYDPRPALRRLRVPTLALNGSLDVQVPAKENLAAIDTALRAAGNRDYRVMELPGLNHLFQTARTGGPAEYATIEETMAPAALEAVASWIVQRFGK
jgi:dienelactone hydrolase